MLKLHLGWLQLQLGYPVVCFWGVIVDTLWQCTGNQCFEFGEVSKIVKRYVCTIVCLTRGTELVRGQGRGHREGHGQAQQGHGQGPEQDGHRQGPLWGCHGHDADGHTMFKFGFAMLFPYG